MGYRKREMEVLVNGEYAKKQVWMCEECHRTEEGTYYGGASEEKAEDAVILHDALCTSRSERVRHDADRLKVLTELFQRGQKILGISSENAQAQYRKLVKLKLDGAPPRGFKSSPFYSKGDEEASFFSEAYLYSLLGKEDARTVLALLRAVGTAIGVPDHELP